MAHQPQPRLVQQVLGHRSTSRHPKQERKHSGPVRVVHLVERVGIAGAEPRDQHPLVV
jgi:hypothetical protein